MALSYLLTTALSSLFYGVIATAVLMTLIYVLLRVLNEGIVKSIPFYISGGVLAILLIIQLTLLIGAVQASNAVDSAEITINQLMENASGTFGATDSQRLLDYVTDEYPIIGAYIGTCDFTGNTPETIASAMAHTMRDYLSSYIWHRVFWIVGFCVVASAIAIVFRQKETNYTIDQDMDLGIY